MQRVESQVAMSPTSGQPAARPARPRWRVVGIAVVATIGAAVAATVASAERDAYLRTHPPVPTLIGKTVAEAARMMVPLHFGLIVSGSRQDPTAPVGTVLAQNPSPGRLRPFSSIIQVRISKGSGVVPRIRGGRVHEAARQLEAVGLRLGRVDGIEDDAAPGTVLEQFVPPGHRLDANGPVDVLVSQGPEPAAARPAAAPLDGGAIVLSAGPEPTSPNPPAVPGSLAISGGAEPGRPVSTRPDERKPATSPQQQEGGARGGSASTDCAANSERARTQICYQPADDRGAQPNLHRPEHRGVSPGP